MDSQKLKGQIFSGLLAVSIPAVSAQSSNLGENQGIEASLLEFMNTILLFEVESAAGVLLYFLAPMAGFYFVQKNMLSYGFELFEERIDRHSYRRTDDDIPDGIKGLSIVTGFITVQMLGNISAGILLATGLISILLAVVMQLGLLEGFGGDGGGRDRNRNTGGNTGNQQNQGGGQQNQGGGGGGINWGNVGQTAANFANTAQQYQQNKQNQSIKNALSVFNAGTDVIKLIDKEPSDFRNEVESIDDGKKGDASDLNSLEQIHDRMQDVESELGNLDTELQNDIRSSNTTSGGQFDWGNSKLADYDYSKLVKKLNNLEQELARIKNNEKHRMNSLHDNLDKAWEDIQKYIQIHEFMENLPGGPGKVASDNDLLNQLASEASNRNQLGGRSVQQGMSDFRSVLTNLDNFESAHESLINQLEKDLSDELTIDNTENNVLKSISSDDEKIKGTAQNIKQGIQYINNRFGGIDNKNSGKHSVSTVKTLMDNIKDQADDIDNHVQDINSVVQSEGKFENESYKKLKKLTQ